MVQHAGRGGRLDPANLAKQNTLSLPCPDPYEPDDNQVEEWRRLGLDGAPDADGTAELHAGFDLQCKVFQCLLDPSLAAIGHIITATMGGRCGGHAAVRTAGALGGRLLSFTVSGRGAPTTNQSIKLQF